MFIFQGELEILSKTIRSPQNLIHPLILLLLVGQILFFITLFQKEPSKILTILGTIGIGLLMIMIAGIMGSRLWVTISVIPYLIVTLFTILDFIQQVRKGER